MMINDAELARMVGEAFPGRDISEVRITLATVAFESIDLPEGLDSLMQTMIEFECADGTHTVRIY